jgi:hypothetical protein
MRSSICGKVLLVSACILSGAAAWGQQSPSAAKQTPVSYDVALTFSPELGQGAGVNNYFWMEGAGLDAVATFSNGWGISAALNGEHRSNIQPNVDLSKITFLAGPRYTGTLHTWKHGSGKSHTLEIFGEGLLGDAHAFNSAIPTLAGLNSSADVFAVQAGGGLNLALCHRWGLRLLQADYVRTALPNNSSNSQNDLRLAFGATYHFGK